MNFKPAILVLASAVLASGCYEKPRDPGRPMVTLESLTAKAQEEAAKGPVITTHQTEHGQVLLVSVPKAELFSVKWIDCVIYRDIEFKTSSIACPTRVDPSAFSRD